MSVAKNLEEVRKGIEQAAIAAGRDARSVELVAVSKGQPATAIRQAYEAGQRVFGENYVQELASKADDLKDLLDLRWHMIGHLQTNKAKQVTALASMIQTIDSERLAREVSKRAQEQGRVMRVLVEVNVGGEEQKSGCALSGAESLVELLRSLPSLEVKGLMTVPPFHLEAEDTRPYFARLRELSERIGGWEKGAELSMGMSHDHVEAIEEGATMVRVGTSIFGLRNAVR